MTLHDFYNKKTMIFVPHEDDEVAIAGGLLATLKRSHNSEIFVVFYTNGDWFNCGIIRQHEAVKSLKVLGINESQIIFLGYPDRYQADDSGGHLYNSEIPWVRQDGLSHTCGYSHLEYHKMKFGDHAVLSKDNLILDLYSILLDELPDIIIGVDYDEHCDHRALSLALEAAIGRLLKEDPAWSPYVLKGFTYATSFWGFEDLNLKPMQRTKYKYKENSLFPFGNPYYDWSERIAIDINQCQLLIFNTVFQALLKHKSQQVYLRAYSVINSDQVFFSRRTDNLLRTASIYSTSGNSSYLNDFLLFDTNNVMNVDGHPLINSGYMEFSRNDPKKEITISFLFKHSIREIIIYQDTGDPLTISQVAIETEYGKQLVCVEKQNFSYHISPMQISDVHNIKIAFPDINDKPLRITEIEIFENAPKLCPPLSCFSEGKTSLFLRIINRLSIKLINLIYRVDYLLNRTTTTHKPKV